jgi:hypothetical protein
MTKYIVTAIYDNIHGTDLGGRQGRGYHYRHSLKTLCDNISDAYFIIYTDASIVDDITSFLKEHFINHNYEIRTYDLRKSDYSDKINKTKCIEEAKKSDRCIELQYSKITWLKTLADTCNDDDYIYWFDAGLSYTGLIPNKYLLMDGSYNGENFYSTIFNNTLLNNLIKFTKDKLFIIRKENMNNFWSHGLPDKYFLKGKVNDYHVIGGIFGGRKYAVKLLHERFDALANSILDNENILYSEEHILTGVYVNHPWGFATKDFDIWWHEDNIKTVMEEDRAKTVLKENKSFYKILEELL